MVSRKKLVSGLLGLSAAGLFGVSVLGLLGRIQMSVATQILSVGMAVSLTIAMLEIESRGVPRHTARIPTHVGRVVLFAVIVLALAAIG